jgi:hypothetical protein
MNYYVLLLCVSTAVLCDISLMGMTREEVEAYEACIKREHEAQEARIKKEREDFEVYEAHVKQERKVREDAIKKECDEREAVVASFREKPYRMGIEKAARGQLIVSRLEPITRNNPNFIWNVAGDRILMASWIPEEPFTRYYQPKLGTPSRQFIAAPVFAYLSWVTAVPQIKNFMTRYSTSREIQETPMQVRVAQLLGLPRPPTNEKRYFVEMWIRPEDLVWPCSQEVREGQPALQCELIDLQPEQTLLTVSLEPTPGSEKGYCAWFREKAVYEYWKSSYAYPWTRLGYTYDWGPGSEAKSHRGLDEFIIKPGSTVILESATLTDNYTQLPTPVSHTVVT